VAKIYTLVKGDLYRRGANGVLMRCITREDGCELLTEIHGGDVTSHIMNSLIFVIGILIMH
jgi:hypothetical protein